MFFLLQGCILRFQPSIFPVYVKLPRSFGFAWFIIHPVFTITRNRWNEAWHFKQLRVIFTIPKTTISPLKIGRTCPQSSSSYHFSGASCWFSEIFLDAQLGVWKKTTGPLALRRFYIVWSSLIIFSSPLSEAHMRISQNVLKCLFKCPTISAILRTFHHHHFSAACHPTSLTANFCDTSNNQ